MLTSLYTDYTNVYLDNVLSHTVKKVYGNSELWFTSHFHLLLKEKRPVVLVVVYLLLLLLLLLLLVLVLLLLLLLLMIIIKKTCFIFCVFSAVKGVTYVIHVASPYPSSQPKDENEVIQPAVEGTQSVLKACVATKTVKRIVLTSSCVAVNCKYA